VKPYFCKGCSSCLLSVSETAKSHAKPTIDLFDGDDDDEGDLFASMASAKTSEPPKSVEKKETKKKVLDLLLPSFKYMGIIFFTSVLTTPPQM
jgi:hypothetical protein